MEGQFMWMMIFFSLAVVIVLILLVTLGWNKQSSGNNQEIKINLGEIPIPPINLQSEKAENKVIEVTPTLTKIEANQDQDQDRESFNRLSTNLVLGFFQSIDHVVTDTEKSGDDMIEDNAKHIASLLCEKSDQDKMVKSYLDLNNLLKEYTKVNRSVYLEKSDFSKDLSGIVDRSISMSNSSSGFGTLNDIKRRAGLLTMIIDGVYVKCLDLSTKSNENFKTYLGSINTMLFRYSELVSHCKWDEASTVRSKAISLTEGAVLTSKSE